MKNLIINLMSISLGMLNLCCRDKGGELVDMSIAGQHVSVAVDISVKDKSGTDLLDPDLPNSLKIFKVSYPLDSVQKYFNRPLCDSRRAYQIGKYLGESSYHLTIILDVPFGKFNHKTDWTTTYIEFEDGDIDTIKAQYSDVPGWLVIDRATYNGAPVWDRLRDNGNLVKHEIVK